MIDFLNGHEQQKETVFADTIFMSIKPFLSVYTPKGKNAMAHADVWEPSYGVSGRIEISILG
ncbi:MAG TPA: hypothetical protein VKY19_25430 [Ktedonosporobacter sp.]|jgi:hypothetical protein|nr:hypothetical protein [Ktedonosporobacter sp.]